jgi:hypothetical protein
LETLQITPAGRRKFAAIEADAEGVVANDPSEGATLAALFGASRVRMGPRQVSVDCFFHFRLVCADLGG